MYLFFWMMISGLDPTDLDLKNVMDLLVGFLAAAAATYVGLRLLPPYPGPLRFNALIRLAARVLKNTIISGFGLLPRVFAPKLSLSPGYLCHPVRLPAGSARAILGALSSMIPGTLAVGSDKDGALIFHCLEPDQGVEDDLQRDETLLMRIVGQRQDTQGQERPS